MRVGGCVSNFLTLKYTNLFVFSSPNRNFALSLPTVTTNQGCIGCQSSVKWVTAHINSNAVLSAGGVTLRGVGLPMLM